jgi:hypothetical protein
MITAHSVIIIALAVGLGATFTSMGLRIRKRPSLDLDTEFPEALGTGLGYALFTAIMGLVLVGLHSLI